MCYNKISVKNPVKANHLTGFDKVYIKAPCNSCPSCRKVKNNDWVVRSYFEFLGVHTNCFFASLDFDNDHLPIYRGMPCFDSQVIHKFFGRLRYYVGKFRYFYATDYGGLLKRPHYHVCIIPEQTISLPDFFSAIKSAWQQGSHSNVEQLKSVEGDKLKAVQYICGYVNKDITFNLDDTHKDMPPRFRPRVQASKGFGLRALEEGIITADMLLKGEKVSLPIGRNGSFVSFPIPRYYEMKYCYDYSYNKITRKSELAKNQLGVQVAVNRHNCHYIHYVRSFFSSRHFYMPSIEGIDLTNLGTQNWCDIVFRCCENLDDFAEFVYYRPFIHPSQFKDFSGYVFDNIRKEELYRPSWQYYENACRVYDLYKRYFDSVKCELEVSKLVESAKQRARHKVENSPALRRYLMLKRFDFSQLYN